MNRPIELKLRTLFTFGITAALITGLVVWRLADHDLDRHTSEPFEFLVADQNIAGTLWRPYDEPRSAIVLVHGDGPQDRTSAGAYAPFINTLLRHGIAVASWDKPGQGGSDGNWLHQTMADRAAETRMALELLRRSFETIPVGAIGFSQAGWVLPRLSKNNADFLVLIGPAVSWQNQGDYFTRTRLRRDGMDDNQIMRTLEHMKRADKRIFGDDAQPSHAPDGMSHDRWGFIRQNRHEDARELLAHLEVPVFAIWGTEDLNVDASGNASIYREILADGHPGSQILLWPGATHGLLKASAYNWQLAEDWSWLATLQFILEGRHAFAPGSLDAITSWIKERTASAETPLERAQ